MILMCRNNGWAISVPRSGQTASLTFAEKAVAYGLPGVLVDGNDILAMIHVVAEAAARARRGEGATLIEARTYRRGAHSTSDDPSVYRDPAEPKEWERRDPLDRLRKYMQARGELPEGYEASIRSEIIAEVRDTLADAMRCAPKPPLASLFEDVYADVPWHLREQRELLRGGDREARPEEGRARRLDRSARSVHLGGGGGRGAPRPSQQGSESLAATTDAANSAQAEELPVPRRARGEPRLRSAGGQEGRA